VPQERKMKENFKIVFFGTPAFALPSLEELVKHGYKISACVTRPDTVKGRHLKITKSEVKKMAEKYNLPVFQPSEINDKQFFLNLKKIQPALFIVVAYGKILPKKIIDLPMFGTLNIHASLLPKYRGASPIHYALLNGDKVTGVTIMKMDEHMDTGPIVSQKEVKIVPKETLSSLHDKLAKEGARLLLETLPDYFSYNLKLQKQDDSKASYTKILKKEDGHLDWQEPALKIERKIRAFNPWPGTFSYIRGKFLKILEAQATSILVDKKPGYFFYKKNRIYVSSSDNLLEIKKLQLEGKNPLGAEEFINGQPNLNGVFLS